MHLLFADVLFKPLMKPYSGIFRFQYFETEGYSSRIYAFENDVLFSYAVPSFSGVGSKYYLVLQYDLTEKISCWLKWSITTYNKQSTYPLPATENENNNGMELKFQLRCIFK